MVNFQFLNAQWWVWWVYCIIVVVIYLGCLLLNYIVKKINEARIEERLTRLQDKVSNTQGVQVHEESLDIEQIKLKNSPSVNNFDNFNSTAKGISLVFNKEDNIMHYNKIKSNEHMSQSLDVQDTTVFSGKVEKSILQKSGATSSKIVKPNHNTEKFLNEFACNDIKDSIGRFSSSDCVSEIVPVKKSDTSLNINLKRDRCKTDSDASVKKSLAPQNITVLPLPEDGKKINKTFSQETNGYSSKLHKNSQEVLRSPNKPIVLSLKEISKRTVGSLSNKSQTTFSKKKKLNIEATESIASNIYKKYINADSFVASYYNTSPRLSGSIQNYESESRINYTNSLNTHELQQEINRLDRVIIKNSQDACASTSSKYTTEEVLDTKEIYDSACKSNPTELANKTNSDTLSNEDSATIIKKNDYLIAFTTSAIFDPQTSKLSKKLDGHFSHKLKSGNRFNKRFRSFWSLFSKD